MGFLKVIDNPMNAFTFAMPIGNKAPKSERHVLFIKSNFVNGKNC